MLGALGGLQQVLDLASSGGLRDYVEERLWAKHKNYPRTLVARVAPPELQKRGWWTKWLRNVLKQFEAEPGPWYWPYDTAGRRGKRIDSEQL